MKSGWCWLAMATGLILAIMIGVPVPPAAIKPTEAK